MKWHLWIAERKLIASYGNWLTTGNWRVPILVVWWQSAIQRQRHRNEPIRITTLIWDRGLTCLPVCVSTLWMRGEREFM